ncbi:hypothetical protein ACFL0V_07405, partial [Nanoarchaeota archaeon]
KLDLDLSEFQGDQAVELTSDVRTSQRVTRIDIPIGEYGATKEPTLDDGPQEPPTVDPGAAYISETADDHPAVVSTAGLEPYRNSFIVPFPDKNLTAVFSSKVGEERHSETFNLATLVNAPSDHMLYYNFDDHTRQSRGVLAVGYGPEDLTEGLDVSWFDHFTEDPANAKHLLPGYFVHDHKFTDFNPLFFFYVKQSQGLDGKPETSLWLYDAFTSEGLSITHPIHSMNSAAVGKTTELFMPCQHDLPEAIRQISQSMMGDFIPRHDVYTWAHMKNVISKRRSFQANRGSSLGPQELMAVITNYFAIGMKMDHLFRELMRDEQVDQFHMLDEYRKAVTVYYGTSPQCTIHSVITANLLDDQRRYSPGGRDDLHACHHKLLTLDGQSQKVEIGFGPRLEKDLLRTYANAIILKYTPE